MAKLDLKKKYKHLYLPPPKTVSVVDVPDFRFLMIDGKTESGQSPEMSQPFQEALAALYGASYTLKFMSKLDKTNPIDYTVMALEALWWTESGHFSMDKKEPWYYTGMMMQPDHITRAMFEKALEQMADKRPSPAHALLRFEQFREGLCIQTMHVGPYADEPRTLEQMKRFAEDHDYVFRGKHHEIYLGDPRRAKPQNLRTVLRQPVQRAG